MSEHDASVEADDLAADYWDRRRVEAIGATVEAAILCPCPGSQSLERSCQNVDYD